MRDKTVVIYGLGYIGLPTSALLTSNDFKVLGVDINQEIVDKVNKGVIHIVEPGLEDLIHKAIDSNLFVASIEPQKGDIYIISVPTPLLEKQEKYEPDISYVLDVAKDIAPLLKEHDLVILESTCPIGTTDKILEIFDQKTNLADTIFLAYCPERVLPGNIMSELVSNDRVVGGVNPASAKEVAIFYKTFVEGKVVETDAKTAEMCKLAENSFRDLNIAFANELSLFAEKLDIDINQLIEITNLHPRVNIHQPGIGVGGHCIAIDPWFLYFQDPENSKLIRLSRQINTDKTIYIENRIKLCIEKYISDNNEKPKVSFFGISYKPDTDDMRESPAYQILRSLKEVIEDFNVVEPHLSSFEDFKLISTEQAIEESDIIVFLVKHSEFSMKLAKEDFGNKIVLDFVGLT